MTVTNRKRPYHAEEVSTINEPGVQTECDGCLTDLTHSIRIKCVDPVCIVGDGVDLCPNCFCSGKEFGRHKRGHPYRVEELHSYPIFTEDWGADEELLLIEGIAQQGLGNWQAIAEHVGTRTKEEVEEHYNSVYIDSPNWPRPHVDLSFDIDPTEFQERKRRRISNMTVAPPLQKVAPTSAPGVHEVATFLPGRLEFEHEIDNEAEDLIRNLEFGLCMEWGGDSIPEDEDDHDYKTRMRWKEEQREKDHDQDMVFATPIGLVNGTIHSNGNGVAVNGLNGTANGFVKKDKEVKEKDTPAPDDNGDGIEEESEENMPPIPFETQVSLEFKLTLIEMYMQRIAKRREAKALMFDRGFWNIRRYLQAAEKKRPKEEKDIVHRLRPFARLQTAEDYEVFCTDILYEAMLRKRIAELQQYRKLGLTTAADIKKWEDDLYKRTQAKANMSRDHSSSERLQQLRAASARQTLGGPDASRRNSGVDLDRNKSVDQASATGPSGRRPPAPLNLANSPSLHLLTPAEQTLCSTLRILPKPYLVIKETLVREYARRGGKLRRREARDLVKIDVNKTSRVWDFLVQAGYLRIGVDQSQQQQLPQPLSQSQPQQQPTPQQPSAPSISGGTSSG
ncbi:hypothetical protein B0F90DRAFT_1629084 [Multifurca ochricompacta]|uniref:Transcriptional adapter 2 n=1 Tax=Multifurca ochricompacta TaxID=376703 RepID=A0AAD4M430_9AGAM|nr:hypothetical protein B0F90DRAFT_1629084 [Multifurca ochricompacta]